MNLHKIILLLVYVLSSSTAGIYAQTCKVSTGQCQKGCKPTTTEVYEYDYVDQKPEFPGGCMSMLSFINSQRIYPEDAYVKGIEGRVTCSFVVNCDGKLSNIIVLRGVEESLNSEAIRIISEMPQWEPGKLNGTPVPVRVVCPVPFRR